MCRHGMTSYIGAAWRLKRAAMSISTMGAIQRPTFAARSQAKSGLFAGRTGWKNS
jgi:hypothetical protein